MVSSNFQAFSSKTTHGSNSTKIGELVDFKAENGELWLQNADDKRFIVVDW